jgi:hypothetical protein
MQANVTVTIEIDSDDLALAHATREYFLALTQPTHGRSTMPLETAAEIARDWHIRQLQQRYPHDGLLHLTQVAPLTRNDVYEIVQEELSIRSAAAASRERA